MGVFSISSFYREPYSGDGASSSNHGYTSNIWQLVWRKNNCIPRVKAFIWRSLSGVIPTLALNKRMPMVDPYYPHYKSAKEIAEHMLLECNVVRAIWFDSMLGFRMDSSPQSLDRWIHSVKDYLIGEQLTYAFTLMWAIWKARNSLIFRKEEMDPRRVVDEASRLWKPCPDPPNKDTRAVGKEADNLPRPKDGDMLCWVDAAWKEDHTRGVGIALWNFRKEFLIGKSLHLEHCESALAGEARAVLEGLKEISKLDTRGQCWLFSNSQLVVKTVNDGKNNLSSTHWTIFRVIQECMSWVSIFPHVKVYYTSRSNNA
ncbi:uncharacterized protein [Typha latifolia]|uniref:uncharacterized protein n=1 Tax=Typha latifolia TaxID=4733 RepID=UPI003C2C660A